MASVPRTRERILQMAGRAIGELYAESSIILIDDAVLEDILQYSERDLRRERGGFLLGRVWEDEEPGVEIRYFVPAEQTLERQSSLTFTHETWARLNRIKDEKYPDEKILGWHHTHPGFGVFLSDMDLFIHKNFFSQRWQVALVVDPVKHELGFFHWRAGDVRDCGFVVVEDDRPQTS